MSERGIGNRVGHGLGCHREPGVAFMGAVAASNADVAPDLGRWGAGPATRPSSTVDGTEFQDAEVASSSGSGSATPAGT